MAKIEEENVRKIKVENPMPSYTTGAEEPAPAPTSTDKAKITH